MISFPKKAENNKQCRDCLSNCKGKDYKKNSKKVSAVYSVCELCGERICH